MILEVDAKPVNCSMRPSWGAVVQVCAAGAVGIELQAVFPRTRHALAWIVVHVTGLLIGLLVGGWFAFRRKQRQEAAEEALQTLTEALEASERGRSLALRTLEDTLQITAAFTEKDRCTATVDVHAGMALTLTLDPPTTLRLERARQTYKSLT